MNHISKWMILFLSMTLLSSCNFFKEKEKESQVITQTEKVEPPQRGGGPGYDPNKPPPNTELNALVEKVENGDGEAMYQVGMKHWKGDGVKQDKKIGMIYLTLAGLYGRESHDLKEEKEAYLKTLSTEEASELEKLVDGAVKKIEEQKSRNQEAHQKLDGRAISHLGMKYWKGDGVEQDKKVGLVLLSIASLRREPGNIAPELVAYSGTLTGEEVDALNKLTQEVVRDTEEALRNIKDKSGSNQVDIELIYQLGMRYWKGDGVEQNQKVGIVLRSVAAIFRRESEDDRKEREAYVRNNFSKEELDAASKLAIEIYAILGDQKYLQEAIRDVSSQEAIRNASSTEKQEDLRNMQRRSDVNTILNAIWLYSFEHQGNFPFQIPTEKPMEICRKDAKGCEGLARLSDEIFKYIHYIPYDPRAPTSADGTRYFLKLAPTKRITVSAPDAEGGKEISVTR